MAAIFSVSALFLGIALMMLGNGLQGSLLGLRGSLEGFNTQVLGLVMSGYFAGFLAGSLFAPKVVAKVGHIRVFAALASLASAAVLVHSIFIDPWVWTGMRLVTGFSYAGLYIVAESWINDMSDNQNRGRLLGTYMVIQLGALSAGQYLLAVSDPSGANLFMIVAVLVSLALLPVCLAASRAPDFTAPETLSFRELYRLSPLGSIGMTLNGVTNGAIFGFAAIYAQRIGLSVTEISTFIAVIFLGGMLLQWPVGRISDLVNRRLIITVVTFAAMLAAIVAILLPDPVTAQPPAMIESRNVWPLFITVAIFGGFSIPMYSLFNAHVNDRVPLKKMVAASSGLIFLNGAGAILGPNLAALAIDLTGPKGFFITLATIHGIIGLLTLFRMLRKAAPTSRQHVDFVAMPVRGTSYAVQLTVEQDEEEQMPSDSEPQGKPQGKPQGEPPDAEAVVTSADGATPPARDRTPGTPDARNRGDTDGDR
ncbi:MAG: MFS transporter [Minwuia sp.]|nr:MFS transporter [Minwuia sp.]